MERVLWSIRYVLWLNLWSFERSSARAIDRSIDRASDHDQRRVSGHSGVRTYARGCDYQDSECATGFVYYKFRMVVMWTPRWLLRVTMQDDCSLSVETKQSRSMSQTCMTMRSHLERRLQTCSRRFYFVIMYMVLACWLALTYVFLICLGLCVAGKLLVKFCCFVFGSTLHDCHWLCFADLRVAMFEWYVSSFVVLVWLWGSTHAWSQFCDMYLEPMTLYTPSKMAN